MDTKLTDYIYHHLKSNKSQAIAISDYRKKALSWEQILTYSLKLGTFFKQNGWSGQGRIIIKGENCLEWIIVFLGCIFQGITIIPIDRRAGRDFEYKIQAQIKAVAAFSDQDNGDGIAGIKTYLFKDLMPMLEDLNLSPVQAAGEESIAEIVFTSGTTSRPKGVLISHKNIYANLASVQPALNKWNKLFRLMLGFKLLSLVPLSHMYGQLIGIFIPLMIGGSVLHLAHFSPSRVIKTIRQYRVWALGVLPQMLEILKDYLTIKYSLNQERFRPKFEQLHTKRWPFRLLSWWCLHRQLGWRLCAIIVGGAYLEPAVDQFWRAMAYAIFQGYGLTEAAPLVTLSDPTTRPGSIGKVLKGQNIKVEEGQIYVKGDNVSSGYFMDRMQTKQAFKDGWVRTGDMAETDREGNLIYKGRKDEVIVRSDGTNVYPDDIENEIKKHAAIKDGVVLGLKNKGNVRIHAVLLPAHPDVDLDLVLEQINLGLDAYQRIDSWTIWPEPDFPRTFTLKVKKREVASKLNKKFEAGTGQQAQDSLYELLESMGKPAGRKYSSQSVLATDLGLDSLDMVQLAIEIEHKYNIDADQVPISGDTTVEELKDFIKNPMKSARSLPVYHFPYWRISILIRTVFQYMIYPFIRLLVRLKPYGRQNLYRLKEPVILAANHTSHLDTLVILYSLPLRLRKKTTALMSIEHHFTHFFYHKGNFMTRAIEALGFYLLVNLVVNTTPLSRNFGFKQSMENIGRLLDDGWSIIIFPEGRITTDGNMKEFEPGVGMIAKDVEAKVMPVSIQGLYRLLKNGLLPWGHWPRRPLVHIGFGTAETFRQPTYRDIAQAIEAKHRNLCPNCQ